MSTFFAYLHRTGRIPAPSLARAQVEQLRRLPSLVEIAESRGLLAPEAIIKVLLLQDEKELSFLQACRELGLWSPELSAQLNSELDAARVPLADLLAADPALSPGLVQELWANFRAGSEVPPADLPADQARAEEADPAPQTGNLLLDESLGQAWRLLASLPDAPAEGAANLREAVHAFHHLKGAIRFQGPASAERWADFGEQAFRLASELNNISNRDMKDAGLDALRVIAADAGAPLPALPPARKEALVTLLKNLRHASNQTVRPEGETK